MGCHGKPTYGELAENCAVSYAGICKPKAMSSWLTRLLAQLATAADPTGRRLLSVGLPPSFGITWWLLICRAQCARFAGIANAKAATVAQDRRATAGDAGLFTGASSEKHTSE